MTGAGVFDRCKALQRQLVDRAALRERRVARANAALQTEILAVLADQPDELVSMVHKALRLDRGQQYLVRCLDEALTQRLLDTGKQATAEDAIELEVDGAFAATFPPSSVAPSGSALVGAAPARDTVQVPARVELVDTVTLPDGRVVPFRYPDPGEPAVELADGTLVAVPG